MRRKNKSFSKNIGKEKKADKIKFLNRPTLVNKSTKFYHFLVPFYGIHMTSVAQTSARFGCTPFFSQHYLDFLKKVENYFDSTYYFGRLYEKEKKSAIAELKKIGSYRGIRFSQGLPLRGQRTHTNASTMKRFFGRSKEWSTQLKAKKVKKN